MVSDLSFLQYDILTFLYCIGMTDSQGSIIFDLQVYFSLHNELKKILYVNKKKDRIHACVNRPEFRFVFSTFRNYEVRYKIYTCILSLVLFKHCSTAW